MKQGVHSYILGVFLSTLWVLNYPPQVTGKVDSTALIWLLEQFTTMEGSLGDQSIVVFLGETTGTV